MLLQRWLHILNYHAPEVPLKFSRDGVLLRMFAIAETGWSPKRIKDFEDFLARLSILKKRYDAIRINYFKGEYRDLRAQAAIK